MPKAIHKETMCCGHKRCPTVTLFDDGSIEISDNDARNQSIGNIKLNLEQVARLVEIAQKKQT